MKSLVSPIAIALLSAEGLMAWDFAAGFAKQTSAFEFENGLGWTPMPTSGPLGVPAHGGLRKRDHTSLCGYINGDAANPLSCESSFCGINTGFSAFGCCSSGLTGTDLTGCTFYTSCLDSTAGCDSACLSNTNVQFCGFSTAPYCVSYDLDYGDGFSFSAYGCLPERTSVLAYPTTTGVSGTLGSSSSPSTVLPVSSSTDTPLTMSDSSTMASTTPQSLGTATVTPTPTPTPTPTSQSKSSTNVGAIAGGVVGGVVVLVIAGVIFWLWRRKRNEGRSGYPEIQNAPPMYTQPKHG